MQVRALYCRYGCQVNPLKTQMNFSLSATAAAALAAQAGEPVLSPASQPMGGAVHEEGEPMQVGDFNAWAFFA